MYEGSIGISTPEDAAATTVCLIVDAAANLTGAVIERRLVVPAP